MAGRGFLFWPPQLAASSISDRACDVRFWHLTDISAVLTFIRYWHKADMG